MKKKFTFTFTLILWAFTSLQAQTLISDFDSLPLSSAPYWNGNDHSGGFASGSVYFNNSYDDSFGGYWATGFAYSSVVDSSTSGFGNMYAAKAASGYNNSLVYAVAQQGAICKIITPQPELTTVQGFYVTNGTYAYNTMRDGDSFSRKFGDTTGTHSGLPQGAFPDFFKLTVKGYFGGQLLPDSVEFYLADYRFAIDSLDYIVKTWEWVDCSSLGAVDSLTFLLASSDMGSFGMNTPAFFCIDNLTLDYTVGNTNKNSFSTLEIFPNPAQNFISINGSITEQPVHVKVYSTTGQMVLDFINVTPHQQLNIEQLPLGMYLVQVQNNSEQITLKILKQ